MYLYQSPEGVGISKKQWEELKDSPDWTIREYKNQKIWVRLHWIGRYDDKLPPEYRHSHGIEVYNRVHVRESEWHEEGTTVDKGYIRDITATETFRTKSAAMGAYDDMILRYTESELHEADNGEMYVVEKGNELAPIIHSPEDMLRNEDLKDAAAEKGIDLGGWS